MLLGGIEGGGSTFVVSVARDNARHVFERYEFDTTSPTETLDIALKWLSRFELDALGVAMFGPLDLNKNSKSFGYVTNTPKVQWQNFDLLGHIRRFFPDALVSIQSDVNVAALAELIHGGHGDITSSCYITVGTGVSAGICVNSMPLIGSSHPKAGHIQVPLHEKDIAEGFSGVCPFHGTCIEGLCSAAAIASRKGCEPSELAELNDEDPVWDIVGFYIGSLCAHLTLICSPEVIVIGGGVLKRGALLALARSKCESLLASYVNLPKPIDQFIVSSKLVEGSGVIGSLELAYEAVQKHS